MRVVAALLFSAACFAQLPATREVRLVEGLGRLLLFERDIFKVAIAEPKIADAVVIGPREVMVTAKTPGRTTVVIWEVDAEPAQWEIEVVRDTSEWDRFRRQVADA